MKKKDVLNLIKCYSENNDAGFRAQAYQIAKEFDSEGDVQLSEYILSLLSGLNTFVPQMLEGKSDFFKKIIPTQEPLPLPEVIKDDLIGLVNAVGHNIGINKFLFHGAPGTGKTESAKQVARLLERELYSVDFDSIIDSKLGQTSKNIATVFDELNNLSHPEKVVILFDEIDAIALDRTNTNDLREMGRATSSILKGFDTLNEKIVLIATTNLFSNFDKALSRRFDTIIDFNRYTNDDLIEIADIILDYYLPKIKGAGKNKKLFRKIMALVPKLPYPGELKNLIKTSLAFSTIGEEFDYLVKLYKNITGKEPNNLKDLQAHNFTVREIEILTGISDDIEKAVRRLSDLGVKNIVMTMGSRGSAVYQNGRCTLVEACKVDAIDATAAGDTFCGALCVALSEGLDLVNAARFATRASALTVQKVGAQESIPFRRDI